MAGIEPPEGFELRGRARLAPATLKARPVTEWQGDLRRLLEAGAGERWLTPREAGFGSAGGVTNGLHARGALLIAEKRSVKRYRLTDYGARVARTGRA
jgi:hypothetical protein